MIRQHRDRVDGWSSSGAIVQLAPALQLHHFQMQCTNAVEALTVQVKQN